MVRFIPGGNILTAATHAIVNPVNCVGVMGKGLALQFKKAFPDNFEAYKRACSLGEVVPGKIFVHNRNTNLYPEYIFNFPTKRHWKDDSRLEDIKDGLQDLILQMNQRGIISIAIPPLGCGLGGLDWLTVRTIIEKTFQTRPWMAVYIFEPQKILLGKSRSKLLHKLQVKRERVAPLPLP